MSINRTRWLDKLRPAGASSGGWTEGPMAPVETTDAATVDQRCPFKHRTGWRHNLSNSKLCVALRMGQANLLSITNCHLCAGAMLSSRSVFPGNSICACHPEPFVEGDVTDGHGPLTRAACPLRPRQSATAWAVSGCSQSAGLDFWRSIDGMKISTRSGWNKSHQGPRITP